MNGIVAKALIINELNQVLVLTIGEHRASPEKSFKPDLPGGMVDPGESEMAAVRREIFEETGIKIENGLQLVFAQTEYIEQEEISITKLLYVARLPHTPEVRLSWEHAAHEWVMVEGIEQAVSFRPFYKTAIAYCLKHGLV